MGLDSAVEHLLAAKRTSGRRASYAADNPIEYRAVKEYLNGGARPIGVITEMGLGLLEVEDERRANSVAPPYQVTAKPASGLIYGWKHSTSPTMPKGHWGDAPVVQLRTDVSWRWYGIYELALDASWPDNASTYGLPLDAHNTPGDIGWDSGILTSAVHVKVRNMNLILQHEPNFPFNEWTVGKLTKGLKHTIEIDLTLGRKDGTTPQSGRTVIWLDGERKLDTGDIDNLQRFKGVNQTKMDILDGLYCSGIASELKARFSVGRWGKNKAGALADAPVVSGESVSPSVTLT